MSNVKLKHSTCTSRRRMHKEGLKIYAELVTASIGNLRKLIKAELAEEIEEIDGIVRGILKI